MKKLLSLLLALVLAVSCLPMSASAKGESLYQGVLQDLIADHADEDGINYDYGVFFDVDGDGTQELLVTRARAAQVVSGQSASVYAIVNGRAQCLLKDQELFFHVGAPDGSIQVVEKDGRTYIAVYYRTGGGGGRYEHQGGWDLYTLDSAAGTLVKTHSVTFSLWYYEGRVLEDECSAVLDGRRLTYAEYDAWAKSMKVKAKARWTGEGSTLPQLLKQAQRGDTVGGFRDVYESDYFAAAVVWAVGEGITSGTSSTTFSPGKPCTRAQIMTFLWASKGKPAPRSEAGFSDMPTLDAYNKAISWAVENQITGGVGNNRFGPNRACTRVQAVTFLWTAAGKPEPRTTATFSDMPSNPVFRKAISWAVENKITGGMGNNQFGTNRACTRGQIAMFLYAADRVR